jgi:hypothetical protein
MTDKAGEQSITARELKIVDAKGRVRLSLSVDSDLPALEIFHDDGARRVRVGLDGQGRPSLALSNPTDGLPHVIVEVDDKGAHVKFDQPGMASAYLFLNNEGGSGVVLIDTQGKRRLAAIVAPDGTSKIERFGDDGKSLP